MKRLFFAVLVLFCSAALLCGCSEDETGMYNLVNESYGNEQYAVQGVFGSNISHYDTDGSLTYDESLTALMMFITTNMSTIQIRTNRI